MPKYAKKWQLCSLYAKKPGKNDMPSSPKYAKKNAGIMGQSLMRRDRPQAVPNRDTPPVAHHLTHLYSRRPEALPAPGVIAHLIHRRLRIVTAAVVPACHRPDNAPPSSSTTNGDQRGQACPQRFATLGCRFSQVCAWIATVQTSVVRF